MQILNKITQQELSDFENAQSAIMSEIDSIVKNKNWWSDEYQPIYDGVADVKAYLESPIKVMWLLKEAYDKNGGGWELKTVFDKYTGRPKNKTWDPIIYATYGILNNCRYEDMDGVAYDESMPKILQQIAYVNLSKMPGKPTSIMSEVACAYETWRDVIYKQFCLYNPDVIIFGNTYECLYADDEIIKGIKEDSAKRYSNTSKTKTMLRALELNGKLYLDAFHPSEFRRTLQFKADYVNTIIQAVEDWRKL